MGKSARALVREIKNGTFSFLDVFNSKNGQFIIACHEGKKKVKTALYRCILVAMFGKTVSIVTFIVGLGLTVVPVQRQKMP